MPSLRQSVNIRWELDFYEVIDNIKEYEEFLATSIRINLGNHNKDEVKQMLNYIFSEKKLRQSVVYIARINNIDSPNEFDLSLQDLEEYITDLVFFAKENRYPLKLISTEGGTRPCCARYNGVAPLSA